MLRVFVMMMRPTQFKLQTDASNQQPSGLCATRPQQQQQPSATEWFCRCHVVYRFPCVGCSFLCLASGVCSLAGWGSGYCEQPQAGNKNMISSRGGLKNIPAKRNRRFCQLVVNFLLVLFCVCFV